MALGPKGRLGTIHHAYNRCTGRSTGGRVRLPSASAKATPADSQARVRSRLTRVRG